MTLRYSDRPMLDYGGGFVSRYDHIDNRFPKNAQPMDTAPTASSQPIRVYESSGESFMSLHHKGQWWKLQSVVDPYTRQTNWKMDSCLAVRNPVRWSLD